MEPILNLSQLTPEQRTAVTTLDADVAVTAGAGSGKTRTLVARYVHLLSACRARSGAGGETGFAPRSMVAITFTEKAAREMRNRIRRAIQEWPNAESENPSSAAREHWEAAYAELDAAPIGTIHSLCASILRTHPAEAAVDPAFEVVDEGRAATLQAQAVEEALLWAANRADAAGLFSLFKENELRHIIAQLLAARLDATAAFDRLGADPLTRWQAALCAYVTKFLDDPTVRAAVVDLEALRAHGTLDAVSGDALANLISQFLSAWDAIMAVWNARDAGSPSAELAPTLLEQLSAARKCMQPHRGSKQKWSDIETPRNAFTELRTRYDATIADLLSKSPDWALDVAAARALPLLRQVYERAGRVYSQAKEQFQALDFDDLEAQAVALLERHPDVRSFWQSQARAVLVDEFQDTNDRQRRIVYALTGLGAELSSRGEPGARLFVVGDAKQSIYRFRGADVTVFRAVQQDLRRNGGRILSLNLTFRCHKPLLDQLNTVLEPIMGNAEPPDRPYYVPFAPLTAHRQEPDPGFCTPFLEFCLGLGENAVEGRQAAAAALARRLRRLHDQEGVNWGAIGILFRASTAFPVYEDALEQAGVPFVTVAGRGFYERPEVRDLLNALRAITNPTDDAALAGLLRSPAFALTDGALYLLRRGEDGTKHSFWKALHADLSSLEMEDQARAVRAREVLTRLNTLVGRVTVAELLKRFLDETHYRAILRYPAGAILNAGGERARRNVDKLLADAHASSLVSVGEFLEYLQTLRDVAAREGEAPVEAGDAVQLMTVHKAKGLEFSVVVIADAAYQRFGGAVRLLLDQELGPVLDVKDGDRRCVMHRLAQLRDQDMEEAEDRRLLYVAATRAREKLLISGHVTLKKGKDTAGQLDLRGWLKRLGEHVGLDQVSIAKPLAEDLSVSLAGVHGGPIGCTVSPLMPITAPATADTGATGPTAAVETASLPVLVEPIAVTPVETRDEAVREREADPPRRVWRIVPTVQRPRGPAWVVGAVVHEALRRWRFPDGDEGFDAFLYQHALELGLTDEQEVQATLQEARQMLSRFQATTFFAELDRVRRYHEIPFTLEREGQIVVGKIDLLYRNDGRWRCVDFKTDDIRDEEQLQERISRYSEQMQSYTAALRDLLSAEPEGFLCFLDVAGAVRVERV